MATLPAINIPGINAPKGARKVREFDVIRAIDYCAFRRIRLNGNKGTLFTLISDRNVETIKDHSNVVILAGHSEYAPEMSKRFVFVSDKRFI